MFLMYRDWSSIIVIIPLARKCVSQKAKVLWSASTGSLRSARNLTFGGKKQKQTARDQAETWIWLTVKLQRLHWHRRTRTLSAHILHIRPRAICLQTEGFPRGRDRPPQIRSCHTAVTHTQTPVPQTRTVSLIHMWSLTVTHKPLTFS